MKTCLSFNFITAFFIFNLFAKNFHWILQSWLHWELLDHYLDVFLLIISVSSCLETTVQAAVRDYVNIINLLDISWNNAKNKCRIIISVLNYEIDTSMFILHSSCDKLRKACSATAQILIKDSMSLHEADSLADFLEFCASVVRLSRVFL